MNNNRMLLRDYIHAQEEIDRQIHQLELQRRELERQMNMNILPSERANWQDMLNKTKMSGKKRKLGEGGGKKKSNKSSNTKNSNKSSNTKKSVKK